MVGMYTNSTTTLTVDYVSNSGDIATVHFANGLSATAHEQVHDAVSALRPSTESQFTFDGHGNIIAVEPTDG